MSYSNFNESKKNGQKVGECCFFRLIKSHEKPNNRVICFKQQNIKLAKKVCPYVSLENVDAWFMRSEDLKDTSLPFWLF